MLCSINFCLNLSFTYFSFFFKYYVIKLSLGNESTFILCILKYDSDYKKNILCTGNTASCKMLSYKLFYFYRYKIVQFFRYILGISLIGVIIMTTAVQNIVSNKLCFTNLKIKAINFTSSR